MASARPYRQRPAARRSAWPACARTPPRGSSTSTSSPASANCNSHPTCRPSRRRTSRPRSRSPTCARRAALSCAHQEFHAGDRYYQARRPPLNPADSLARPLSQPPARTRVRGWWRSSPVVRRDLAGGPMQTNGTNRPRPVHSTPGTVLLLLLALSTLAPPGWAQDGATNPPQPTETTSGQPEQLPEPRSLPEAPNLDVRLDLPSPDELFRAESEATARARVVAEYARQPPRHVPGRVSSRALFTSRWPQPAAPRRPPRPRRGVLPPLVL